MLENYWIKFEDYELHKKLKDFYESQIEVDPEIMSALNEFSKKYIGNKPTKDRFKNE